MVAAFFITLTTAVGGAMISQGIEKRCPFWILSGVVLLAPCFIILQMVVQ